MVSGPAWCLDDGLCLSVLDCPRLLGQGQVSDTVPLPLASAGAGWLDAATLHLLWWQGQGPCIMPTLIKPGVTLSPEGGCYKMQVDTSDSLCPLEETADWRKREQQVL